MNHQRVFIIYQSCATPQPAHTCRWPGAGIINDKDLLDTIHRFFLQDVTPGGAYQTDVEAPFVSGAESKSGDKILEKVLDPAGVSPEDMKHYEDIFYQPSPLWPPNAGLGDDDLLTEPELDEETKPVSFTDKNGVVQVWSNEHQEWTERADGQA